MPQLAQRDKTGAPRMTADPSRPTAAAPESILQFRSIAKLFECLGVA